MLNRRVWILCRLLLDAATCDAIKSGGQKACRNACMNPSPWEAFHMLCDSVDGFPQKVLQIQSLVTLLATPLFCTSGVLSLACPINRTGDSISALVSCPLRCLRLQSSNCVIQSSYLTRHISHDRTRAPFG